VKFTVVDQMPTMGDLCDYQLAYEQQDPFAALRLLLRWSTPTPTIEQLRAMPVTDVADLMDRITANIRQHSAVLALAKSQPLKLQ